MASEAFPLFRDYSLAIRDWLRETCKLPRFERHVFDIESMTRTGTAKGGVNQHEIKLTTSNHPFRKGHPIQIYDSIRNDEYYVIKEVDGDILILDMDYRRLLTDQPEAVGKIKRAINVVYANMDRSVSLIAQPLRQGLIDSPGIGFYISDYQFAIEKSRPKENYYTRKYKDNNIGGVTGSAAVPPLLTYQVHYMINIWSVYMQEMDILQYQVVTEFNPEKFFWIGDKEYGFDYKGERLERQHKGQWAHALIDIISDVSDLEPGDATNRTLRHEIGFMVTNAYLPMPFNDDQSVIGAIDLETITRQQRV